MLDELEALQELVGWARRFTIMYVILWTVLTFAFFALLLFLNRGAA